MMRIIHLVTAVDFLTFTVSRLMNECQVELCEPKYSYSSKAPDTPRTEQVPPRGDQPRNLQGTSSCLLEPRHRLSVSGNHLT